MGCRNLLVAGAGTPAGLPGESKQSDRRAADARRAAFVGARGTRARTHETDRQRSWTMDTEQEQQPEQQQQKFAAPKTAAAPVVADLSAEIAATIDREPGDRVKCTWVSGNNYRCNWWAPGNVKGYD